MAKFKAKFSEQIGDDDDAEADEPVRTVACGAAPTREKLVTDLSEKKANLKATVGEQIDDDDEAAAEDEPAWTVAYGSASTHEKQKTDVKQRPSSRPSSVKRSTMMTRPRPTNQCGPWRVEQHRRVRSWSRISLRRRQSS